MLNQTEWFLLEIDSYDEGELRKQLSLFGLELIRNPDDEEDTYKIRRRSHA